MTKIPELKTQNLKIKELSRVLEYLISNKEMCNTQVTCDLFLDYAEQVTHHLYLEEKDVYGHLLNHHDSQIRNTSNDFFSGSIEIKRVFNEYLGRWCRNKKLRVIKHQEFLQDSKDIFELVLNRVNAETTILYPMIEDALDEKVAA